MHVFLSSLLLLAAHSAAGFFILTCDPLVQERKDPIVSPGQTSQHAHAIMGGSAFADTMTHADALKADCTTCTVTVDKSNYWHPQMYFRHKNGSFTSVRHTGSKVYYLFRMHREGKEVENGYRAFPKDFRMVAGDPFKRAKRMEPEQEKHRTEAIHFVCKTGLDDQTALPKEKCDVHGGFNARVRFPSCWDGKNATSADHRSHIVYGERGEHGPCPDTHPFRTPTILFENFYDTKPFEEEGVWWEPEDGLSPYIFANGDSTGYGYHGDFLNGWDMEALEEAVKQCSGDGGNVEDCAPLKPSIQEGKDKDKCKLESTIDEQVLGTMDKLPGCNPLQSEDPASETPSCGGGGSAAGGGGGKNGTAKGETATEQPAERRRRSAHF